MEFSAKKNGEKQLTSSQQSSAVIMGFSGLALYSNEKTKKQGGEETISN